MVTIFKYGGLRSQLVAAGHPHEVLTPSVLEPVYDTRPYLALLLSALLALSYTVPAIPPSFAILAAATSGYALVLLNTPRRRLPCRAGVM